MSRPRNRTAIAAFVVGGVLSGCTSTPAPLITPAPSSPAPSSSPLSTAATTGTPSAPTPSAEAWPSAEVSLPATGAATAGSYLTDIRVAGHPEGNFDRIALDFRGQGPDVRASYVSTVFTDASGLHIELDGSAYLRLAFRATAHDEAGQPTLVNWPHQPASTGLPGLRSYVMTGDYEGVLSIALGQATKAGFKVGQVGSGDTTTIYVDVRRP